MKKLILLLLLVVLSCKEESIKTKLDQEFTPIYNEISKSTNPLLKDKAMLNAKNLFFKKMKTENFIDDYPLYFDNYQVTDDGYVFVNFRTAMLGELMEEKFNYDNYDRYSFNIIGKIKASDAEKLNKEKPCFVKGFSITEVPDENVFFIEPTLNLGNVVYDIKSVSN